MKFAVTVVAPPGYSHAAALSSSPRRCTRPWPRSATNRCSRPKGALLATSTSSSAPPAPLPAAARAERHFVQPRAGAARVELVPTGAARALSPLHALGLQPAQ